MKKLLSLVLVAVMLFTMSATCFVSNAAGDPADSYTPITAPAEDSSLQMWFEHSTHKVLQEETTSTGRNTYSVYMAKNEKQGAQVILYSTAAKSSLSASISEFTAMDGSGATIPSQLYYEFYVKTSNLHTRDIYGLQDGEESIIKEGMTPDAIAPIESINNGKTTLGRFSLAAGKTQALYYNLTTTEDTPSGWYSATFNVTNSSNEVIKTATVYAYVWDFVIPEDTGYQTSFYISAPDNNYQEIYDYFLENRLLGMNVPGELTADNPYLTNPRVNAFRIANHGSYLGKMTDEEVTAVYEKLSASENWELFKSKAYFYTVDEPTSQEQNDLCLAAGVWTSARPTVDTVKYEAKRLNKLWPDPWIVLPIHENTPYPYKTFDTNINFINGQYVTKYSGEAQLAGISDAVQGIMDSDAVSVWCAKMCAYTPRDIMLASGYNSITVPTKTAHVRNLDGIISGFHIATGTVGGCYFDWDSKYGTFSERFTAYQNEKAAEGKEIREWWYSCGNNANYTYAGHLIENTGLQTQIMAWQAMQEGVTGYLYYGVDLWTEMGSGNYTPGTDKTYSGSAVADTWPVNRTTKEGYYLFGNGVLCYGSEMRSKLRLKLQNFVGTIRVEQLRDGVEDYGMLGLYRDIYGEEAMQAMISKVSDNVACYLSLPLFDTSGYASTMSYDDIFAQVRIEVGNAVENGNDVCTDHAWGEGVETVAPTCTTAGIMTYTCTKCGATRTEKIATVGHTAGEPVVVDSTCTAEGSTKTYCTVCDALISESSIPLKEHTTVRKVLTPSTSTTAGQWQNYCTVCEQNVGEVADLPVLEKFSASIADVTVKAGEEVTISVNADIPSTGLWGTVIHAVWDKALGADVAFANGDVLREFQAASASEITDGNLAKYAEYGITFDKTASDYYKSAISAFPTGEDQTNVTADGTLYTMTLTAPKAAGTYYVGFVVADEILGNIWEPDGNYYTYDSDTRIVWAKIIVEKEAVEGDVDGDGKLSAKDISALNNILAGFRDETPTADVNGDGKITARDISALRNIIAGY